MAGKTLLLAIDGSEHGARALDRAVELALALDDRLSIVHVLMHGRPPEELERMAEIEHLVTTAPQGAMEPAGELPGRVATLSEDEADRERHLRVVEALGEQVLRRAVTVAGERGLKGVRTHLERGDDADRILDVARDEDAAMIVIGWRGLGRMRDRLLGSVSQKVAQRAQCDVLIVK